MFIVTLEDVNYFTDQLIWTSLLMIFILVGTKCFISGSDKWIENLLKDVWRPHLQYVPKKLQKQVST